MENFLEAEPPIDWSELNSASKTAERLLRQLAADKPLLRRLLTAVPEIPNLFEKCECHPLDDKIVIYDSMQRQQFRIRFRLATTYQDERPHTHRFPFTTLILRGAYYQTFYKSSAPLDESVDVNAVEPIYMREDDAGSAMTIHHEAIHSTIASPDTISLLLRGPAAKERAIITHKEGGKIEWRVGEHQESAARRDEIRMSLDRYRFWCSVIEDAGLI